MPNVSSIAAEQAASTDKLPPGWHCTRVCVERMATRTLGGLAPSIATPCSCWLEYAAQPPLTVHPVQLSPMHAAMAIDAGDTLRSTTLSVPSWLVTHRQPAADAHGYA